MTLQSTLPRESTELTGPPATDEADRTVTPTKTLTAPWYYGFALPLFAAAVSFTAHNYRDDLPWVLTFPGVMLLLAITAAACTDLMWRKIPNWITYPATLAAMIAGTVPFFMSPPRWMGGLQLSSVVAGIGFCFLCMLFPYRASGGGAGDVKIAAVIGGLLGWQMGLSVIVWAYLTMGICLLIGQFFTAQPWLLSSALARSLGALVMPKVVGSPDEQQQRLLKRPIPLGGAFAVGVVCVLSGGNLFG